MRIKKLINFLEQYSKTKSKLILNLNVKSLSKIIKLIKKTYTKSSNVFICGNGGSASVANHWACDHSEGIKKNSKLKPKTISLNSNIEIITATSNDFDFSQIFKKQFENLYDKNDLIICFSVSGNSKNIIEVLKYAKKKNVKSILFSGMNGGIAKNFATHHINFNSRNFGLVEDCFQSIMHIIAQNLYNKTNISF